MITDGAFPTRGTMLAYILRWAEIYVGNPVFWKSGPDLHLRLPGLDGPDCKTQIQAELPATPTSSGAVGADLAPRPWLAIHGQKDAYIGVDIARANSSNGRASPKELWIVEGAKHNRCREKDPVAYGGRVSAFVRSVCARGASPHRPSKSRGTVVPSHRPLMRSLFRPEWASPSRDDRVPTSRVRADAAQPSNSRPSRRFARKP